MFNVLCRPRRRTSYAGHGLTVSSRHGDHHDEHVGYVIAGSRSTVAHAKPSWMRCSARPAGVLSVDEVVIFKNSDGAFM